MQKFVTAVLVAAYLIMIIYDDLVVSRLSFRFPLGTFQRKPIFITVTLSTRIIMDLVGTIVTNIQAGHGLFITGKSLQKAFQADRVFKVVVQLMRLTN